RPSYGRAWSVRSRRRGRSTTAYVGQPDDKPSDRPENRAPGQADYRRPPVGARQHRAHAAEDRHPGGDDEHDDQEHGADNVADHAAAPFGSRVDGLRLIAQIAPAAATRPPIQVSQAPQATLAATVLCKTA